MRLRRITIKGDLAHFKIPASAKIQKTLSIPYISTIVGTIFNLFGEELDEFTLGYIINYNGKNMDFMKINKELNLSIKSATNSDRFKVDHCYVEELYNVEIIIYTDIEKELVISEPLVLGKTNYLAHVSEDIGVDLIDNSGFGYNQYTTLDIGEGFIRRINTLTKYNSNTDMYDYLQGVVRENEEFEYDKNYDKDLEQNVFLWKWNKGEISNAR